MRQEMRIALTVLLGLAILIGGCSGSEPTPSGTSTTASDAPAEAVLRYLEAKIAGNRDGVRDGLCSAMESEIDTQALSFSGVDARLENASCTTDEGGTTVTCTGEIVAVYGTENRSFPLTRYNVVEEDGQWRWCGEAAS